MAYEIEDIRLSQEIFYYLLEHHELREDNELRLYKAYTQEETIQNLETLRNVLKEKTGNAASQYGGQGRTDRSDPL